MEAATTEFVQAPPAPALRALVPAYTGYRMVGAPGTHQGVPSGRLTVVLSLDGTIDVLAMPDPSRPPASFTTLVGGLHDAPAVIGHDGRQYCVQLDMTWQAARALLGLPAGELAHDVVDLDALLGGRAGELAERLAAEPDWTRRFALLDRVLTGLAGDRRRTPPPEVVQAWQRLRETGGRIPVGDLARELGWSRRHLGERFRRETGLAPKAAARVIRFERACRRLRSPARPAAADVAAACGYVDQPHLAREFRDLAGVTMTRWLRELPSVQDDGARRRPA